MTLPAAAERMPAAIDRYLLPGSRLQQAVDVIVNRWDRQTDGQTDKRTARHPTVTYYAGSVDTINVNKIHIHTYTRLTPFVQDYPGQPVPER